MNIPQIISHRGDQQSHAENTIGAFECALAAGIPYVELDLQINASGSFVVLHDPNLRRTHGVDLSVFDQTDGQPPELPTLAEVLDLADRYSHATLCLEMKHDSLQYWGEESVLEMLKPWAERIKPHVLFARSTTFLQRTRTAGLGSIGVILRQWLETVRGQLAELEPEFLVVDVKRVPDGELLWPGPWKWAVYEIGDFPTALAWGDRGADFILSFFAVELEQQRRALLS